MSMSFVYELPTWNRVNKLFVIKMTQQNAEWMIKNIKRPFATRGNC